jgi:hypothetical protein
MKKTILAIITLALLAAVLFAACSKSSSDSPSARNCIGTQSPGDVWSWTITLDSTGAGTFSAKNETLNRDYSGSVSTMPNKFLKLLVTATTDTTVTSLPAVASALEVPGTVLIVKPAGNTENVIVAVASGDCPTQSATYNLVQLAWPGWNAATSSAYEVDDVAVSGSDVEVFGNQYLLNGTVIGSPNQTGLTCSNGRISIPSEPGVVATVTPSGAIMQDGGPNGGGVFGMQAPATNVDLNDVILVGREFRGVVFEDNNVAGSDDTHPIWARPNGFGGMKGGDYTDFEAGTENTSNTATITFSAQASKGVVNGGKTDSAGSVDMVFMINKIGGKYLIYGVGADSSGKQELFIAIER